MSERGQGTIEYAGLVALLALVVTAAATLWVDPQTIGGAVTRAFARGICVVAGGFCDADRQPCVTASESRERGWHVNVAVIRYGESDVLIREQRSDGTVALTRTRDRAGGLDVGVGIDGRVNGIAVGATMRAATLARLGRGETYVVDGRQADALQARIAAGDRHLPRPATTYGEWGAVRDYQGTIAAGPAEATIGFAPGDTNGTSTDTATGRRTAYLAPSEGWRGSLTFGDEELAGAAGGHAERYGVVTDREGRARELVVAATGELRSSAALPSGLAEVAGLLMVPAAGAAGRRWSTETRLDLSDPDARRAARSFVEEIRRPRPHVLSGAPSPSEALRRLLRERGRTEARTYALEQEGDGFGGHVAAGVKVGGAVDARRRTMRLLAAASRGPDGVWRGRRDCLARP